MSQIQLLSPKLGWLAVFVVFLFSSCNYDSGNFIIDDSIEKRSQYYENILPDFKLLDSSLTVLTYNVHVGFPRGLDAWDSELTGGTATHLTLLADAINSVQPDIVALQEVPYNRENTVVQDFMKELAIKTEMNFAFGSNGKNVPGGTTFTRGIGEWGNGILSKYPIYQIENREIDFVSNKKKRSVLKADILLSDTKTISVYSAHYRSDAVRTEDYISSITNTLNFIDESDHPALLMGDFNFFSWDMVFDPVNELMVNAAHIDPDYKDVTDMIFIEQARFESLEIGTLSLIYFDLSDHEGIYSKIKVSN